MEVVAQEVDTEPMSLGRIIDSTFSVFSRRFAQFFTIGLIAGAGSWLGEMLSWQIDGNPILWGTLCFTAYVTNVVLYIFCALAGTRVVADEYRGKKSPLNSLMIFSAFTWLHSLWLSIVATLLVILALLALIVPGIWVGVSLFPLTAVFVLEGERFSGKITRCFELVKNNWWRAFGIIMIIWMIHMPLGFISAMAKELAAGTTHAVIASTVQWIAQAAMFGIWPCAATIFYFDARNRREGLDIERMLDEPTELSPAE